MKYATITPEGVLTGFYDSEAGGVPPQNAIPLTDAQSQQWLSAQQALIWQNDALVAAPVPQPSFEQKVAQAFAAGCAVISAGNPALSATYGCDSTTITDIMAEAVSLLLGGNFTNGTQTLQFADLENQMHSFNATEFKAFATAVAGYVGALKAAAVIGSGALPNQPVEIT